METFKSTCEKGNNPLTKIAIFFNEISLKIDFSLKLKEINELLSKLEFQKYDKYEELKQKYNINQELESLIISIALKKEISNCSFGYKGADSESLIIYFNIDKETVIDIIDSLLNANLSDVYRDKIGSFKSDVNTLWDTDRFSNK